MATRRRGKFVMMEYRQMKTRFGNPLAKQIRDEKREQEKQKGAEDSLTYWMVNPDTTNEDLGFEQKTSKG